MGTSTIRRRVLASTSLPQNSSLQERRDRYRFLLQEDGPRPHRQIKRLRSAPLVIHRPVVPPSPQQRLVLQLKWYYMVGTAPKLVQLRQKKRPLCRSRPNVGCPDPSKGLLHPFRQGRTPFLLSDMGDATVEGRRHQFHVETLALSATASLLRRERIFQLRHMKRTQANHLSLRCI